MIRAFLEVSPLGILLAAIAGIFALATIRSFGSGEEGSGALLPSSMRGRVALCAGMAAVATVLAHLFVLVDVRSVLEAWLLMMEIWLGCGVMMRVANIAFAQKKKFHILAATAVGDLACLILMATVLVLMR